MLSVCKYSSPVYSCVNQKGINLQLLHAPRPFTTHPPQSHMPFHSCTLPQVAALHAALQHQGSWLQQLLPTPPEAQQLQQWVLPPQQTTLEQLQVRFGRP